MTASIRRQNQDVPTASIRRQNQDVQLTCGNAIERTLEIKNKEGCTGEDCTRRYRYSLPPIACEEQSPTKEGVVHPFILPIMFSIHCFGCGWSTFDYMSPIANQYNFIWVNPEGLQHSFNAYACCGYAMTNGVDDVQFFRAIIQDLQEEFPNLVSPDWVYGMGWSNGGYMVSYAAHLFRGIAPVSGYEINDLSIERPTAIFLNHAKDDPFVQSTGCCTDPTMPHCCCGLSNGPYDQCTSVDGQLLLWAEKNQCNGKQQQAAVPKTTISHPKLNVTCHMFQDCQVNTTYCLHYGPVGHFNHHGFENTFPWSVEIVEFFATHMCEEHGSDNAPSNHRGRRWDPSSKVCDCPSTIETGETYSGPYCTKIGTTTPSLPPSSTHSAGGKTNNALEQDLEKTNTVWEKDSLRWTFTSLAAVTVVFIVLIVGLRTRRMRHGARSSHLYSLVPLSSSGTTEVEMGRMR